VVRRIEVVDAAGDVRKRCSVAKLRTTGLPVEGCPKALVAKGGGDIIVSGQHPPELATMDRVFLTKTT
jgi:hypothetical protein